MPRRAFSLIELLAVIGIIGLLIGIAIPTFASIRLRTYEVSSLSNLSQIGKTTELYATDYKSYFFGTSGPTRPGNAENQGWVSFPVWALRTNWPLLVHQVAPWSENYEIWISPKSDSERFRDLIIGQETKSLLPISYHFSNSFVADPRVWGDVNQVVSDHDIKSIKPSTVRYPSAKVIVFDVDRGYLGHQATLEDRRPVLMADGSAKLVIDTESTTPVVNKLRPNNTPYWYHDTAFGVYGRDF